MNKLKIAGIIIMVAAAVVFLILFFGKHVNSTRYTIYYCHNGDDSKKAAPER